MRINCATVHQGCTLGRVANGLHEGRLSTTDRGVIMGDEQDRQAQERQRIEQQLKDEIEDLDVKEGADEVIGGTAIGDPSCGPVQS